jgi:hypothetical protein
MIKPILHPFSSSFSTLLTSLLPPKSSAISRSLISSYVRSRLVPPRFRRLRMRLAASGQSIACAVRLQLVLVHQSAFLDQCYNIFPYEHVTLSIRWSLDAAQAQRSGLSAQASGRSGPALPHADGGSEPRVCVTKWWSRSFRTPSANTAHGSSYSDLFTSLPGLGRMI